MKRIARTDFIITMVSLMAFFGFALEISTARGWAVVVGSVFIVVRVLFILEKLVEQLEQVNGIRRAIQKTVKDTETTYRDPFALTVFDALKSIDDAW